MCVFFLFCRQTLYKKKLRLQTKIIIWPCTFQRVLWYPIHIVCIQNLTKLQWLVISWLRFIPKPKLLCFGMQLQFLYLDLNNLFIVLDFIYEPSPCNNSGVCVPTGDHTFECDYMIGFYGQTCNGKFNFYFI